MTAVSTKQRTGLWSWERPETTVHLTPGKGPLVYFGGQTTITREVCLDVQIQEVTRTCLLDTGSEVNLYPAGLVPPGTEIRSVNGPVLATNGSEMYLMAK